MPESALDSNAKQLNAIRPIGTAVEVTNTAESITVTGVARLASVAGGQYGLNVAASIEIPAGGVEYIAVRDGDTLNVSGTINVLQVA